MLMPSIFGENLFDDWFGDFVRPARSAAGYQQRQTSLMKTDVKEKEGSFELDIELPGYKKEDVKAELKDGYLNIEAKTETNKDEKDEDGKYIRKERYSGVCRRSFFVGEAVEQEDIKAKFEDGVLKIAVPKKEAKPVEDKAKYISIEG